MGYKHNQRLKMIKFSENFIDNEILIYKKLFENFHKIFIENEFKSKKEKITVHSNRVKYFNSLHINDTSKKFLNDFYAKLEVLNDLKKYFENLSKLYKDEDKLDAELYLTNISNDFFRKNYEDEKYLENNFADYNFRKNYYQNEYDKIIESKNNKILNIIKKKQNNLSM